MHKALIGAGAAICLLPAQVHAEWYSVGSDVGKSKWFMDPERVKLIGGKAQAWVRIDGSADRSVQWNEEKLLMSFDCAAGTVKTLSAIKYDSYGKVISSSTVPDYGYGYEPVVPDSMGETVQKLACMVK